MTQRAVLPLLAALATCAYAASSTATANATTSTVIDVLLPMLDSQTVMASVEAVDATATTYFITCPTSESSVDCGLGSGMEIVEGSSVLEVHYTESAAGTFDISCAVASETAVCTSTVTSLDLSIGTATVSSMVTSTGTATITGIDSYTMPITVTAGLDKLEATAVSTGGMPRITQNAVLAGAAVMVGGVLLM